MSAKAGLLIALALDVLCALVVRAEDPPAYDAMAPGQPMAADAAAPTPSTAGITPGHLSDWITYTRPDCCGPLGGNGPISYDIYLRTGPSLPMGSGFLARQLAAGWEVAGGGRSLFFNLQQDAAWVIDLGLSFTYNHVEQPVQVFSVFGTPETVNQLHRTLVNVGIGREWYLIGTAGGPEWKWRVGADVGGRYGPARLELHQAAPPNFADHFSDVIGGAYVALHSDVEVPCGCCKFLAGFRAEWDYTWMDILPQTSDVQDVNLLLNVGLRF